MILYKENFNNGEPEFIDLADGQMDIDAGVIRFAGDIDERITEDPLRMLRVARFATELGFWPEEELVSKIRKNASLIYTVSKERWTLEMDKLLTGKYPAFGLSVLEDTELLRYIIPELWLQVGFDQDTPHHHLTLWEHTKKVVSLSPEDPEIRWGALLHDVGKPYAKKKNYKGNSSYYMHAKIGAELARGIAYRLKWSAARTEKVCMLILEHMNDGNPIRDADNHAK